MINSLKLNGDDELDKSIMETAFEYLTFSLKRHISEKIGKKKKYTLLGKVTPVKKELIGHYLQEKIKKRT
jgi:hypothetical protein